MAPCSARRASPPVRTGIYIYLARCRIVDFFDRVVSTVVLVLSRGDVLSIGTASLPVSLLSPTNPAAATTRISIVFDAVPSARSTSDTSRSSTVASLACG